MKTSTKSLRIMLAMMTAIAAVFMVCVIGMPDTALAKAAPSKQITRLYNPKSGEHHYTADHHEVDVLVGFHGWKYEGTAWWTPVKSKTPVYRLYNPKTGEHHYTADANEKKVLSSKSRGWKYEGIAWYSDDAKGIKVTRLFNRKAPAIAQHHYTLDTNEVKVLSKRGWKNEGVAWYAMKLTYTVKFNANGGKGVMKDQVLPFMQPAALRKNTFTRPGYKFLGWSRDPDGRRFSTLLDSEIVGRLGDAGETTTLYALWTRNAAVSKASQASKAVTAI